jgi:DNA-binding winged helix-turn-helix (wHTH) protein/tetratricopeptide (TPR) repeat protein
MPTYAFGPFFLDPAERRLTRGGRRVAVPSKAWQILVLLAEAGGRLVAHETFRAKLWPNVVVEDRTLTVHVSTLRKALGSGPPEDYIETVARAGYRLAVPVRILCEADRPPQVPSGPPTAETRPLAVGTFSTGDLVEADTYLGVGIADAVTTALGALPGLAVSPAGAAEDLSVARTLGLGHLLEGAVQRSSDQLQVSARLIDVASGHTEWSERFEHPVADGAALQDAIAQRVANSLAQLSTAAHAGLRSYRPRSSEAYLLQLEGRASLKLHARLSAMKALGLFERAETLDPDYATAHAGLASTYLHLGSTVILRPLPIEEAMPLARESAERALALDEELAEAWAVLGRIKMEYDWDWDGAEADLAHAVALNPNSVEALAVYGQFLGTMGRHDESLETMEQARRLDPRRLDTLVILAIVYTIADDPERALATVNDAASMFDSYVGRALITRMLVLDQVGRHDEAMAERLALLKRQSGTQGFAGQLGELDRSKGWRAAMVEWITLLERTNRWMAAAMQCMAIDEPARAIDALERCVSERFTHFTLLLQSPSFRALRGEPRFRQIMRMLKLDGRIGVGVS